MIPFVNTAAPSLCSVWVFKRCVLFETLKSEKHPDHYCTFLELCEKEPEDLESSTCLDMPSLNMPCLCISFSYWKKRHMNIFHPKKISEASKDIWIICLWLVFLIQVSSKCSQEIYWTYSKAWPIKFLCWSIKSSATKAFWRDEQKGDQPCAEGGNEELDVQKRSTLCWRKWARECLTTYWRRKWGSRWKQGHCQRIVWYVVKKITTKKLKTGWHVKHAHSWFMLSVY